MKKCLFIFIYIFFFNNSICDYIIPFCTINIGINQTLLNEDFLSNILSQHLCAEFIIGSNKEKIKNSINMSQIGFYIYDKAYDYNSSSSYKFENSIKSFYHKDSEKGYDSSDNLCLVEYDPKKKLNSYDIKKCKNFNGVKFELLKSKGEKNKTSPYAQYGIIGLGMHSNQDEYIVSTFIKSLKDTNMIDSHYFSFNFIDSDKQNTNQGYLYLGQEHQDENLGIKNKVVSMPINGQTFWNLKFHKVYSVIYNESNSSIYNNYRNFDIKIAELIADLPYIIGIKSYKSYIDNTFFRELINKDVCSLKKMKLDQDYSTFVCDNTSKLFKEKFENNFPKLIFEHFELNKSFILDKNDLFTYNYLNKSDHNIYFLIFFSDKKGKYNPYSPSQSEIQRWKLGIPFFKKYKLIINADSREISYYEIFKPVNGNNNNDFNNDNTGGLIRNNPEKNSNQRLYLILEIGGIILLLVLVFLLGFLFHKNIIKLPRKKKANELEDEYEYSINPNDFDEKKASLNNYEVNT